MSSPDGISDTSEMTTNPEVIRKTPLIVGVIGPSAIGKDTLLEKMGYGEQTFSIGRYIEENAIKPATPEVLDNFINLLESNNVTYTEDNLIYKGKELVELVR